MLQAMRGGAKSPIMKVFLVFLAAGFALWGVGDVTTGLIGGSDKAISAGDESLSPSEVAIEFDRTRRNYMPQASTGEAIQAGLLAELAGVLARDVVFRAEAGELGLTVTRDMQRSAITDEPAFRDELGNFSQTRFLSALANAGISEAEYLERIDTQLRRQQIVAAVAAGTRQPDAVARILSAHDLERRTAQMISVPVSADAVPAPDETTLSEWFETVKSRYEAPALRSARVGYISPSLFADSITLDEDDIVAAFEDRRDEFTTPETRTMRQMVFDSIESADTAFDRVSNGEDFNVVAADLLGWSTDDVSLGTLPQSDLDTAVGEAAFKIGAGEFIGPVESAFGFHVIAVDSITPGTDAQLEDVRADITATLRLEAATDAIYDSANALEDSLASGATLDEAINTVGGKIVTLTDIDMRGRDINGAVITGSAAEMAQDTLVVDVIWNADPEEISILQEGNDDMFFVVETTGETAPRERSLDEVRSRATGDWQLVEAIRIAREAADALANDDSTFVDIEPTADFRRNGNGLDHEAARLIARAVFGQAPGSSTVVETGREAIALRTNSIIPADAEELETTTGLVADFTANALQLDVLNTLARDLSQTHDLQIRLGSVQQLLVGNQNQ